MTDPRLEQILEWRKAGETLVQIGERLGISREGVRQIIQRSGVPLCRVCKRPALKGEETCMACVGFIADCLDGTIPRYKVAAIHGHGDPVIARIRRAAGIPKLHSGSPRKLPDPLPADVLDPAIPIKEVAEQYGVRNQTIGNYRRKHGIRQRRVRRPWTPAEDRRMFRLLGQGKRQHQVAALLERTDIRLDNSPVRSRLEVLARRGNPEALRILNGGASGTRDANLARGGR